MINIIYTILLIFILSVASCSHTRCRPFSVDDDVVDFRSMSRAAFSGDIASVKVLLKRGIPPNGISPDGIHVEGDYDPEEVSESMLLYHTSTYIRPIQSAAEAGNGDIVKLLLAHGANPNWCCCDCVTALHLAILNGHKDVANLLIEHGADFNVPLTTPEKKYNSCLELAQEMGLKSTVDLIKLKKGITKE